MVSAAVSQGPSSRSRALKEEDKGPWSRTRMRQQGGDKSVSHRAVFVEPLSSDYGDKEHIWVKMPLAAVEEQLSAGHESCSIGDSESETSVTRSRRVTGGTRMEALVMWALGLLMSNHFNFTARQTSLCREIWSVIQ